MNQSDTIRSLVQAFRAKHALWFATSRPEAVLARISYQLGAQHATHEIATGNPEDWHPNDIANDTPLILAYIRVEQLRLQRNLTPMGGDASKFNVLERRSRAGFDGPMDPAEDPEPFDESTGPMPSF